MNANNRDARRVEAIAQAQQEDAAALYGPTVPERTFNPRSARSRTVALHVMTAIHKDMLDGKLPEMATSLEELEEHTDTNEYVLEALDAYGVKFDAGDSEQAAMTDAAMDLVNRWLAGK